MDKLPLHHKHTALGARFITRAGWEIPDHYGDPGAECGAVRQHAGLADRSFRGKLRLGGGDRVDFLQGMVTNDVQILKPGDGCYAAITTAKAKMVSDCRVYCLSDSFLMDLEPETVEKVSKHLDFYVIAADVAIEDMTKTRGLLSVYGPESPALLEEVLGVTPPSRENHWVEARSAPSGTPPSDIMVVCNEMTGESGFDVWLPTGSAEGVFEGLLSAGATCVGQSAVNTLRIEAGIPRYGTDMDETHFPMEAGLTERAVSESKGCYIGQETIARALAQGHMNRSLMGLELDRDTVPDHGTAIRSADKTLGSVTSAAFSPTLKKVIALGYLPRDFANPGTAVEVAHDGQSIRAVVSRLPFYKRSR